MIIERDGKRYELTATELRNAFLEQERAYHAEDVTEHYGGLHDGAEFPYSDADAAEIAEAAMGIMEHNDTYWDCYWDCFAAAIREFEEQKCMIAR